LGATLVFFLSPSACAPTTNRNKSTAAMQVEVELDVFSGIPNPSWALTADQAQTLARQLAALRPSASRELSGHLGYRGFVVQIKTGASTRRICVQRGIVQSAEGSSEVYTADETRALERWLLETGRPHVKSELIQHAERELR
jgi:hypothetical protein